MKNLTDMLQRSKTVMECYSEGRTIRVGAEYECKMMPALKFALYTVLTTVLSQK